jgi:hypothetical protein
VQLDVTACRFDTKVQDCKLLYAVCNTKDAQVLLQDTARFADIFLLLHLITLGDHKFNQICIQMLLQ